MKSVFWGFEFHNLSIGFWIVDIGCMLFMCRVFVLIWVSMLFVWHGCVVEVVKTAKFLEKTGVEILVLGGESGVFLAGGESFFENRVIGSFLLFPGV